MKYKGIKRKTIKRKKKTLKRKKKTLKRKKKTLKRKILHLCTIKSPTSSAFIGSKGNSYHALEKCEGVNVRRCRKERARRAEAWYCNRVL